MQFQSVPLGNCFGVKLDISDVKGLKDKAALEPFLTFNVKTYKVFSFEGDNPERFKEVAGAANWYLERATDEEKQTIAQFFALSCQMIRSEMASVVSSTSKLSQFTTKLGEMYLSVVDACHLREAFAEYANNNIQLQDITGYGDRPQDSKELTFSVEEMCQLMNLAFLIKMVAPIFGELILNIPDQFDDEGNKKVTAPKDIKVVTFLQPLISAHYSALDDKLQFFIEHIVKTQCKNSNTAAAILVGLIQSTRVEWIRAAIMVRNFVCCKLERADSNIVRFVDTMVHSHITAQNNFANKNQVRPRKPVAAFGVGEDSDNTAQMETDSMVSNRPFDTEIIIATSVKRVVDDFLIQYEITHDEMNQCFKYLMNHPVVPTPLNRFLACAIFGDKLGGGRGIEMLEREPFTRLICLLQMIAFKLGLREFGHMLTAGRTDMVRVVKSAAEIKFELNYSTHFAYRNCRDKFTSSSRASDGKEWDQQMKDICDDITQTCYVYNTPPFLLDMLGDSFDAINGDTIPIEIEIINEACTIIDMFKR